MMADKGAADIGQVALALAQNENPIALEFVEKGLTSSEASDRMLACAVVARLGEPDSPFTASVAQLADSDDDAGVRAAALAALIAL